MSKRAKKQAITKPRSDYGTPESQQHGEYLIESADVRLGVTRRRRKSQWQIMQDRGTITAEQHAAAIQFENDFHAAGLIPHYASADPNRTGGRAVTDTPQRMIDATKRVYAALDRFGMSPTRDMVWNCIGCAMTLDDYVQRERWNLRSMDKSKAVGRIQVALDTLAAHYGIKDRRAA